METYERHTKLAIDILSEWAVLNQQQDYFGEFIANMSSTISGVDSAEEYILNKFDQFNQVHQSNDDSLFINPEFIPQCILDGSLLLFEDKLKVLIILLQHFPHYTPQQKFFIALEKAFEFKHQHIQMLSEFILSNDPKAGSKEIFRISPPTAEFSEELEGDWIDSNKPSNTENVNIISPKTESNLLILFFTHEKLFLIKDSKKVQSPVQNISVIGIDDEYVLSTKQTLSFSELKSLHNQQHTTHHFALIANNFSHKIRNKEVLSSINFTAYPGELIAIAGNEGAGKSTLLAVLAGLVKPSKGSVNLNAYNIQQYKYQLSNLIGFVPEDDLLFSNLTAYENINYTYKLSTSQSSYNPKLVDSLFEKLGLLTIRNKKVGKSEDKNIFPYQRRLLNIARELVRDPKILIIDNSKSGLSLSDSSKVIDAITPFTYEGKIIITSISETNKTSFKNFDKLLVLCNDGRLAYYGKRGNTIDMLSKLLPKGIAHRYEDLTSTTSDSLTNIIDHLADLRIKDEQLNINKHIPEKALLSKKTLPPNSTRIPRLEQQYLIYTLRNFKTKISKQKELSFSILSAPLISLLLSAIARFGGDNVYSFGENENIPIYFYISILVCVFLGISQSIGEIISDRRLLIREESINLSFFSYINAKTSYLLLIVFIQTFLYTIIGNSVLEISSMTIYHWIVYFSSGSAGIMLGLFFSSFHTSFYSAILKTLPITMLILLILGGGIIPLNTLQNDEKEYTPFLSDLTINRWAYEAIMVKQFTDNKFNEEFYEYDKSISNGAYNIYHILPKLKELGHIAYNSTKNNNAILVTIKNQLTHYNEVEDVFPFEFIDSLSTDNNVIDLHSELEDYITYLDYYFRNNYNKAIENKNNLVDSLNILYGNKYYSKLSFEHDNKAVRALTTQSKQRKPYILANNKIIPKTDLIFKNNTNNLGRAAFFMHEKQFNDQRIETYEFNLSVIWVINLLVYVLLISNFTARFNIKATP